MKDGVHIIQFMPYFPPHKGGLETVGEEIGKYWIRSNSGAFINIVTEFNQDTSEKKSEEIIFEGQRIGYRQDGYSVLVVPSFEIISNFPVYKIWSNKYKLIHKYVLAEVGENRDSFRVITHTRFFLTSFIGGLFARKTKINWVHIEHGSDYVKLSSNFFSFCSYIYDRMLGKWIFKKVDKILAISEACKSFVNKNFINRDVEVFYRGLEIPQSYIQKSGNIKIVFIGRLVTLKGVEDLIRAFRNSGLTHELMIIGDGEEKKALEKASKGIKIQFLGYRDKDFVLKYLSGNNCILVNPSYQEGLPTTVIEGLITGNVVIASDVGGTKEISKENDLILFEAGDINELTKALITTIKNYGELKGLSMTYVEEKFKWDNNIDRLYKLIK